MLGFSCLRKSLQYKLLSDWGGWIRTSDFLINSQALCQLSYTPKKARAPLGGADHEN